MGFFAKIKEGLQKTRNAMVQSMQRVVNSFTKIDEELFEQLEETLIMGDMGVETSMEICDRLRKLVKERGVKDPAKIMDLIEEIIGDMMGDETALDLSTTPSIIMVIGVNGAGKTTTIGKLCHQFKQDGKKVLVAAADTFRAAAIEQLEVWTQRAGVDIVKHAEGSDPAAVVFDAVTAAIARQSDVLIVDTAGRLHNKKNLMNELEKISRILNQKAEGCAVETLLVLDATTGQNAVSQARLFSEVANITGIVLTKLDGTAKGGIVVSIKNELGIPVKLVGVGEKIDDLQVFNNHDFVRALFDREEEPEEETSVQEETPVEEKPVAEEPAVEEPVAEGTETEEEPAVAEPVVEAEPAVAETPVEEAPAEEPASLEEPLVLMGDVCIPEEPMDEPEEAPAEEETSAPAPVEEPAEEPVEESASAPTEEPAAEEPAPAEESAEEPAPAEEPAAEEPAPVEEPAAEEPAPAEEPAAEEPAPAEEEDDDDDFVIGDVGAPEPKKRWWQFWKKKDK